MPDIKGSYFKLFPVLALATVAYAYERMQSAWDHEVFESEVAFDPGRETLGVLCVALVKQGTKNAIAFDRRIARIVIIAVNRNDILSCSHRPTECTIPSALLSSANDPGMHHCGICFLANVRSNQ
ncbi:MAG: hypothetical protein KDN22_24915 [Verrucomicrobiae bacterium]|nr:hypothetical protein [Verrucomicrobiae bacterium]